MVDDLEYPSRDRAYEHERNRQNSFNAITSASSLVVGTATNFSARAAMFCLAAESHDKHRAALNGERNVACDYVEVTFKCGFQAPSLVLSHLNTV